MSRTNIKNRTKLFCFPYAGASASVYHDWSRYLDDSIELCMIELAGRGRRINEPFYPSVDEAIADICERIGPSVGETPYALFGHSMGAFLAYHLYFKLIENAGSPPSHVFLSGIIPPHLLGDTVRLHEYSDEQLYGVLEELGGIEDSTLRDGDLMNVLLPILKADFRLTAMAIGKPMNRKLRCDISVFFGIRDEFLKKNSLFKTDDIYSWKDYSTAHCRVHLFEGGHFFVNEHKRDIVGMINRMLKTAC